jgi:nucleotide-binding universal stress UspA family protein
VTVLTIEGGAAVPGPTGDQVTGYLQSHGIPAKSVTVGLEGRSTGQAILANAEALRCDLLVKGAYTQSRLRQLIFGGATRDILLHATLPVFMAH